jgi:hypothetical protein
MGGTMARMTFVQTWDTVPGRKQEYAAFMATEFLPTMKAAGVGVDSGWYTLLGGGPRIWMESPVASLSEIDQALSQEAMREMLNRFLNLVSSYSSCVLEPSGWGAEQEVTGASQGGARYLQIWDGLPGGRSALEEFLSKDYLPEMARVGLKPINIWRVALGAGPRLILETTVPDMLIILNALTDKRYLRSIVKTEELALRHENRFLIPHQRFMNLLDDIYGRAMRSVSPDEFHSMVGPVGE